MNQLYKILSTAIFLLVFFFVPNNIAAQSEYLIDTKEEFENAIIQTGLDTNSNPGNIQLNSFVPTSAPAIDNRNVAVLVYNDSAIDSDLLFLLNSYFKAFVYQSGSVDDDVYNFSSINELSQLSKYQILIVYCANTSEAKEAPQSIIDAFADSGRIVIEGLLTYGVQRQLEIQTSEVNYKLPLTNARDIAYDGEFIWTMDEILVDKILKISPLNGSIIDSYCAPSTVPRGMVFSNNILYISDSAQDKLYALEPSNLTTYDNSCLSPYKGIEYNLSDLSPDSTSPWGLTNDGSSFYLTDSSNNYLYQFSINGTSLVQEKAWIPNLAPRPASLPRGLAYSDGIIYLADAGTQLIYQISQADGTVLGALDPWDGFSSDQDITGIVFIDNDLWAIDDEPGVQNLYNLSSYNRIINNYEYFNKGNISFRTPSTDSKGLVYDGVYFWIVDDFSNKLYKLDGNSGAVINSCITPGPEPNGLAFYEGVLYVSDSYFDLIYLVNPIDCSVINSYSSPGTIPKGLAHDGTFLWHVDTLSDLVYKLNPSNGSIISTFASPASSPRGLAYYNQSLWISDESSDTYFEVDPDSGALQHTRTVIELSAEGITFKDGMLWSVDDISDRVFNVDSASISLSKFNTPGLNNAGFAFDGTTIWSIDQDTDTLYKIDIQTGSIIDSFASPGSDPQDISWDGTSLWLITNGNDYIYKIDPTNGAVLSSFSSPSSSPKGIVFFDNNLYTSDDILNRIYKLDLSGLILNTYPAPGSSAGTLASNGNSVWLHDKDERVLFELELSNDNEDEGIINRSYELVTTSVVGISYINGNLWTADNYFDKFFDDSTLSDLPQGIIAVENEHTVPYNQTDSFYLASRNTNEAFYMQRRLTNIPENATRFSLVNSSRGGALVVEEKRNNGGSVFAMDITLLGSNYEVSRQTLPAVNLFLNLLGIQTNPNGVHENTRPTYSQLVFELDTLVNNYPNLYTKEFLGKSSNNEDINSFSFGKMNKPMIVLVSGIHGNEEHAYIPEIRFMQNLALKYNSNDPIALNIFENYQVVFIPLANPYGIEHLVRFNINGVDLNRNFDYNWSSFSSDVKGDSPFSEVEAQVLRDFFLENVENIILVNDSHSAMQISPGMTWGELFGVNPPKDIASIYSITTAIEPYRWFEERAGVGRWLSYDRYEVQSNKPYFGNWLGSIGLPCSTNEVQGKLDIGTERMIFTSSWYITHFESIFSALSGKVGKTVFNIESIDPIVFTNNVLVEGLIPPESSVNIRYGSNSNQTLPTNFYSDFNAVPENSNLFIEITLNRSAYDNLSPNIDSLKVFYDSVQILPTVTPTVSPTITVTPTVTITVIPTATATLTPSPTEVPVTITTTTTISPKPSSNNSNNNAIITPTLSAELDNIDNPLDSNSDLEKEETLPKNSPIVTNVQNNKETLTADSKSNDSNIILTSILLLALVITSSFVIIFFKKRKSRPSIEKI